MSGLGGTVWESNGQPWHSLTSKRSRTADGDARHIIIKPAPGPGPAPLSTSWTNPSEGLSKTGAVLTRGNVVVVVILCNVVEDSGGGWVVADPRGAFDVVVVSINVVIETSAFYLIRRKGVIWRTIDGWIGSSDPGSGCIHARPRLFARRDSTRRQSQGENATSGNAKHSSSAVDFHFTGNASPDTESRT